MVEFSVDRTTLQNCRSTIYSLKKKVNKKLNKKKRTPEK
jgi:hypothetical protein